MGYNLILKISATTNYLKKHNMTIIADYVMASLFQFTFKQIGDQIEIISCYRIVESIIYSYIQGFYIQQHVLVHV